MNVLSLFSGIGGLELGLERAGMTTVGQVEIDGFCQRVLEHHWPEVPKHDDVRTAVEWWRSEPRPTVDVVAGGFPCQPVSDAGRRLAQSDSRWLWPEMLTVIRGIRPDWVIGENVPGLRTRGLSIVERDLRSAGYRVRSGHISACAMGAPHPRNRLFVLAHTEGEGRCPWGTVSRGADPPTRQSAPRSGSQRRNWWAGEPRVGGSLDGFSTWVDRSGRVAEAHKLLLAYANATQAGPDEILRALRHATGTEDDRRTIGRPGSLSPAQVLLAFLRQLEGSGWQAGEPVASPKTSQSVLRELRSDKGAARASLRRQPVEQRPFEPPDSLHALSQLLARLAGAAWAAYRRSDAGSSGWGWEDGIARVAYGVPSGVDRRRALGNAVVPQVSERIGRLIMGAA